MDFFEKNNFPTNDLGVILERENNKEDGFSLFIKDKEGKVIGCGIYDSETNQDELYMGDALTLLRKISNADGFKELKNTGCFFFSFSDNHYYIADIDSINPQIKKATDLKPLTKHIIEVVERESQNLKRKANEQLEKLTTETERLTLTLSEKDEYIKVLEEKSRQLKSMTESYNVCRDKLILVEHTLECEYVRNTVTITQLKKTDNKEQIKSLTKEPFWFDEPIFEDGASAIRTRNGIISIKRKLNEITDFSICPNYPKPILKVRVKYKHWMYSDGGDGYPPMYYPSDGIYFFLINEDGTVAIDNSNQNEDDIYALINFEKK